MPLDLANPYATPPDFSDLACSIPAFAPYLRTTSKGLPTIDFKDPKALRALTSALLERDFKLRISLPDDRLCPIVPGRLEYVLWILRLASIGHLEPTPELTGLDIGTGSSVIYPLLACRTLSTVRLVATDIDPHSLAYARRNIDANGLSTRIVLITSEVPGPIFPESIFSAVSLIDFTMCNPPFYSSAEDVEASQAGKEHDPFSVCTGGNLEMITEGGEAKFVGRMVTESVALGNRIKWFSSLLGKLSSVTAVIAQMKGVKVDNYAIAEIGQGQTKRWIVAWSFQDQRLPDSIARSTAPALLRHLPLPNLHSYHCHPELSLDTARTHLATTLAALELSTAWTTELECEVTAFSNSWSRGARRAKAFGRVADVGTTPHTLLLRCRITLSEEEEVGGGKGVLMEAVWERGSDRTVFAGFWAHLTRRVGSLQPEVDNGMDLS